MSCNTNLITSFMSCTNEHEAIEITEKYECPNMFTALADGSGEFLRFSKTVNEVLGIAENQLLNRSETIFSLSQHSERLELFRAFSRTLTKGHAYRIMHHVPKNSDEKLPVVTHMKKVLGESGEEMLLCLNVLA